MHLLNLHNISVWFIIIIFTLGFFVNILGPAPVREEFRRWGLPQWLRVITGLAEGGIALLLITGILVGPALLAASVVMGAATITVLRNGEQLHALLPVLVMIVALTGFIASL
ncbi:DoxX family protein [Pantoea dispersa]|uniref:DoxX family protein n=1 Tax=Pantoea dispersa TaxID=59814 RepID=UPI0028E03147|nr:DoxX family protein [Pantoea dispersa]MDT8849011.1 DoxX family protein [Pantoea dispersa]